MVEIKALCRRAGIAQLDAGTRGASIGFRKGRFANPDALVKFIAQSKGLVKVQPVASGQPKAGKATDMKLVFKGEWETPAARLKGARGLVQELARMAELSA